MIKVAIIGASGYTGGELIRILAQHPQAEVSVITSRTHAGKRLAEVFPSLAGVKELVFSGSEDPEVAAGCAVVFLAVPHGVAMQLAPALLAQGQKVIDLGADFRFRDPGVFETWYKTDHSQPQLARGAVYGLPELYREQLRNASLIGNPGCYPTSIILGLYPLLRAGLIDPARIIIDSKSGVSGAGRKPELGYHYPELFGNFKAYGLVNHRHTPEIEQELSALAGQELKVSFTPHLLPVARGILSTIHLSLKKDVSTAAVEAILEAAYQDEPFLRLLKEPALPELKQVVGTNLCQVAARVDSRTGQLIVVTAIDNLIKGASGQAVQNLNLSCGLEETMGLVNWPVYP